MSTEEKLLLSLVTVGGVIYWYKNSGSKAAVNGMKDYENNIEYLDYADKRYALGHGLIPIEDLKKNQEFVIIDGRGYVINHANGRIYHALSGSQML